MQSKKTKVLTIRVTPETMNAIQREADKREWSKSKMAEKIISTWAELHKEEYHEEI